MPLKKPKASLCAGRKPESGFTLVEMLTTIAVIAILSSLLLPALSKARTRAQSIACMNNNRQLVFAWQMYANDHDDRLPYNLGGKAAATNLMNWAAGVLDWNLTPDNTNVALLTEAAMGGYMGKTAAAYHCPADYVLSGIQKQAGWRYRVRSYSMNASVGDAGSFSTAGYNVNNPAYVQFFKLTSIPRPSEIFAFLDEHPDSIGDGYFLNKVRAATSTYYHPSGYGYSSSYSDDGAEWLRLPASYHGGAASFSFADGHAEIHHWQFAGTRPPSQPNASGLPIDVPSGQTADFYWLAARMSIGR